MLKKLLTTALLAGALLPARAQESWSLRRCIDYAIANNISIQQQALSVDEAETNLSTSRNSRLPSLSAGASQNFNFGMFQSQGSGVYESANAASSTNFSLNSSVPVFAGMRINNQIRANELNLKAATENLKKAKENLELQVTALYLDVLFKMEIARVFEQQRDLTAKQVERTEALLAAGKVPRSQLFDIKAQLAKDELNVTTSAGDRELALLNLAQSLSIADPHGFSVVEPSLGDVIVENRSSLRPPEEIYETALGIKPHIREAEYRLQSSQSNLKVTQAAYWPTLNMGLSYSNGFNQLLGSGITNTPVSDQWKNNKRETVGLTLNVPIFSRLQTRNQVRLSRLDIRSRALELDDVKLTLQKEIRQASQNALTAEAKYASTEKAYEAAAEAFTYAQERYEVGMMTVYEYNEAQTKVITSESEQLQAKYDFLFRAKILDFYRGIPIHI